MISVARQHLGRLAAEFTVIVAGILIALAADAILERRAEREREVEILRTLVADLAESADNLRRDSEYTLERSASLQWYLSLGEREQPALSAEQTQELLVAANVTASYSPILRAYEALIATGSLDLISNDGILYGLADVKRMTDEYLDYRSQTTNVWLFSLIPVWLKHVGSADGPGLVRAIEEAEFRGAIGQRMMSFDSPGSAVRAW